MVIEKFGVVLESLTSETIELVRIWRNDPQINKFMDHKKEITVADQKQWFEKIQKENADYFLIRKGHKPIGMIHIEKIDLQEHSARVGLFIGDVHYHGSGVALAASLILLEYAFETLDLNLVFAKVKNDNIQAIQYNQFLGFEKYKDLNDRFSDWILKRERFQQKRVLLLKYVTFLQ